MDCLATGSKAVYQGESSLSAKQHHSVHRSALDNGTTSSPLVHHALEVHGGVKPHYVAVIGTLEPKPLQRAVREAVNISCQPSGPGNLNMCMEWGCPRVLVLRITGGNEERDRTRPADIQELTAEPNPRPNWLKRILEMVKEGKASKVRLIRPEDRDELTDREVVPSDMRVPGRRAKKLKRDVSPSVNNEPSPVDAEHLALLTPLAPKLEALGPLEELEPDLCPRSQETGTGTGEQGLHLPPPDVLPQDTPHPDPPPLTPLSYPRDPHPPSSLHHNSNPNL